MPNGLGSELKVKHPGIARPILAVKVKRGGAAQRLLLIMII